MARFSADRFELSGRAPTHTVGRPPPVRRLGQLISERRVS